MNRRKFFKRGALGLLGLGFLTKEAKSPEIPWNPWEFKDKDYRDCSEYREDITPDEFHDGYSVVSNSAKERK